MKTAPEHMIEQLDESHRAAAWFIRHFPSKREDILGASHIGLARACNKIVNQNDEEIKLMVRMNCRWAVRDYLRHDHLINIPARTFRKNILEDENSAAVVFPFDPDRFDIPAPIDEERDCRDLIDELNLDATEKYVISLRLQDYTMQEIGDLMEVSKMTVCRTCKSIKTKMIKAGLQPRGKNHE